MRNFPLSPAEMFLGFWRNRHSIKTLTKREVIGRYRGSRLQMICGTLNPTGGTVHTNSRVVALLELGSGFNPEFSSKRKKEPESTVFFLLRRSFFCGGCPARDF